MQFAYTGAALINRLSATEANAYEPTPELPNRGAFVAHYEAHQVVQIGHHWDDVWNLACWRGVFNPDAWC